MQSPPTSLVSSLEPPSPPTSTTSRVLSIAAAAAFALTLMVLGYYAIGLPPVVIVGGSSVAASVMWIKTYLKRPLDPKVMLPPFLLTVAALELHMAEEYVSGFGPAISRTFGVSWTEHSFLMVFAFIGPALYALTALGLYYKKPIAGFLAWFILIGPGVAEFTHFIFPLIQPAIDPHNTHAVTQVVRGTLVENMPNYWVGATGDYYYAGMYTALLPMIPGIYGIVRALRASRSRVKPT